MSVPEAALRLGVDPSRVRAMIAAGLLDAEKVGGRWLVGQESVERRLSNARTVGRSFGRKKAWGLLLLAAGERPHWLSPWDLSRVRHHLRDKGLAALVPRLQNRAATHAFRAHPSDLERISTDKSVVLTGISAAGDHGLDLVAPGQVEIYLPEKLLERFAQRFALQVSERPNLLIHAVAGIWPFRKGCRVAPASVVGVDLLDANDSRTRRVGRQLLERLEARCSI
jgi:excisionase family DNA binding protein